MDIKYFNNTQEKLTKYFNNTHEKLTYSLQYFLQCDRSEGEANYIIGFLSDSLKMCPVESAFLSIGYAESPVLSILCDVSFVAHV